MLDPDVLRAAHIAVGTALEAAAQRESGVTLVTPVGSPEWMTTPWQVQVATLAVAGLSELLRADQEAARLAAEVKAAGVAVSADGRWSADRASPSAGELAAIRGDRWAYCAWPECRQKVKVPRCTLHR
jgi:hypothetical protein